MNRKKIYTRSRMKLLLHILVLTLLLNGMLATSAMIGIQRIGTSGRIQYRSALTFAQLTDTHFGFENSDASIGHVQNAIELVNDEKTHGFDIDFVIVTGDITDHGRAEEFQDAENTLAELDPEIPYYTIAGNHDHQTYLSYMTDHQSESPPNLPYCYTIDYPDIRIVAFGQPSGTPNWDRYVATQDELKFLDKALSTNKTCIVASHWLAGANEGYSFENLKEVQQVINGHRNCVLFIGGHTHVREFEPVGDFYQFAMEGTGGAWDDTVGAVSFITIYENRIEIQAWHSSNSAYVYTPQKIETFEVTIIREQPLGVWRPFDDTSIWNTKIPEGVAIHPNSDAMIDWFQKDSSIVINIHSWTIPVYHADASTPRYNLSCENAEWVNPIPIPDETVCDPKSDGHTIVIAWNEQVIYDFWRGPYGGPGNWWMQPDQSCVYKWELNGDGVATWEGEMGGVKHTLGWGCRASTVPLIAGLIRRHELEAGVIPHALAFAMGSGAQSGWIVSPPALTTDGYDNSWNGIPEGARLQLDPSYDISGLSPAGQIIAKALQDYGMFLVDNSGGTCLYAENDMTSNISSLLSGGEITGIPGYAWRVIAYDVPGVTGNLQEF